MSPNEKIELIEQVAATAARIVPDLLADSRIPNHCLRYALRESILDVLESRGPLDALSRSIVLDGVDACIAAARGQAC